jgi:hypothetical protein
VRRPPSRQVMLVALRVAMGRTAEKALLFIAANEVLGVVQVDSHLQIGPPPASLDAGALVQRRRAWVGTAA